VDVACTRGELYRLAMCVCLRAECEFDDDDAMYLPGSRAAFVGCKPSWGGGTQGRKGRDIKSLSESGSRGSANLMENPCQTYNLVPDLGATFV